ncbi:MAG: DUF2203 domain-containing protein [Planctomycetes bacterium]|nr:DUF2203 domain-containing protein [Planctomycetota bacterium]MCB9869211.1 DUF2203 domain-containing protein [Planctomycetota bacterium]
MSLRTFTPAEANRTLPLVKRIVGDILATAAELRQIGETLRRGGVDQQDALDRAHPLQHRVHELIEELGRIGCDYKDWGFEMGLVDFPGFLDGQPVLLCWRSDEPAVAWYHAPDAGYAGRRRIPADLLQEGT